MAPARVLRAPLHQFAIAAFAMFTALVMVVASGTPADADPAPTAAQIEAQIATIWDKLEPLVNQYNKVTDDLSVNQGKAARLQQQLQPLQLQVDIAMSRVSDIAVQMYMGGPASAVNAILASGSPTMLADQLTLLDQMALQQRQEIGNVTALRDKLSGDMTPLTAVINQEKKEKSDLDAQKQTISAQMNQLETLRQQAYGNGSGAGGSLQPVVCPFVATGTKGGGGAATFACKQIGKPYVWATAGPKTFDCSGLTLAAWATQGVNLYHFTGTQRQETKRVSASELLPGDLVFYFSDLRHVAMYVGGGWVVHAPHPGDVVRMARMTDVAPVNSYGRPG